MSRIRGQGKVSVKPGKAYQPSHVQYPVEELPVLTIESLLKGMKDQKGTPYFTQNDIDSMMRLKWSNGSRLMNFDNRPLTFELIWFFISNGVNENTIGQIVNKDPNSYPGSSLIFDTVIYDKEERIYHDEADRLQSAIDIVRGENQCEKCKSYKTASHETQAGASSDEPMKLIIKCFACGHVKTQR